MCGLAGIVTAAGIDPDALVGMGQSLRHRGPDGGGVFFYSPTEGARLRTEEGPLDPPVGALAGLVHRRLKILDLTDAAAQPMAADGVALVFNGEIYNYPDLRRELQARGAVFSSSGDTEVVLRSYLAWGSNCFQRFNGMWAIAIIDGRRRCLVLSRDRFGIKPLYYTRRNGTFAFASEVKALLRYPGIGFAPDERTVARYLGFGVCDDGKQTFFRNVFRFPAAHWAEVPLTSPDGVPAFRRYWHFPADRFDGSEAEAVQRFRDLFWDAVATHHRADVPSGNCLSGGLDSSSIVCAGAALRGNALLANHTWKSFGYVPADERLSERPFMEAAAKAAGAHLDVVTVDATDFERAVPTILAAHDEPVGSASVCAQWFVFKRASDAGIRVMLDGQGADEMLGGYLGYLLTQARSVLAQGRIGAFLKLRRDYGQTIGKFPLSVVRMLVDMAMPAAARRLLLTREGPGFSVMAPGLARLARYDTTADLTPRYDLGAILRADLQARILPGLLRYEDANSMAFSIEARLPFLDHRLVEFAFSLPDSLKVHGMARKIVLNNAMKGIVPVAVLARTDKVGFKADPRWTRAYAAIHLDQLVDNATDDERAWFDGTAVRRLLQDEISTDTLEMPSWRVINLKHWIRSWRNATC